MVWNKLDPGVPAASSNVFLTLGQHRNMKNNISEIVNASPGHMIPVIVNPTTNNPAVAAVSGPQSDLEADHRDHGKLPRSDLHVRWYRLVRCRLNVVPASVMLAQHWHSIGPSSRVIFVIFWTRQGFSEHARDQLYFFISWICLICNRLSLRWFDVTPRVFVFTILTGLLKFCSVLFCSVLFCSVLFCSVLFCSVLFCSVLFCSVLFCSVLFCFVLFCSVLFCSVLFCSVLFCSVLFCSVLLDTALHCTALHCTALHCTALHCTALHCIVLGIYHCTGHLAMVKLLNHQPSQQTQNICITVVQCWTNVGDIGSTLYTCYTNVLCLLGYRLYQPP